MTRTFTPAEIAVHAQSLHAFAASSSCVAEACDSVGNNGLALRLDAQAFRARQLAKHLERTAGLPAHLTRTERALLDFAHGCLRRAEAEAYLTGQPVAA